MVQGIVMLDVATRHMIEHYLNGSYMYMYLEESIHELQIDSEQRSWTSVLHNVNTSKGDDMHDWTSIESTAYHGIGPNECLNELFGDWNN